MSGGNFVSTLEAETRVYQGIQLTSSCQVCEIIEHFAFNSKRANPIAQYTFRQFARKGFEQWVKEVTGFKADTLVAPTVRDNVDALAKLTSSLQYLESSLGVNLKNPRWNQHLQDIALTTLGVGQQPALPAAPEAKWQGVREAAEELGFMSVAVNKASQLGKLVKAGYPELEVVTEERLCNGIQRPIRLYKVTPAFLNAVKTVCQKLS